MSGKVTLADKPQATDLSGSLMTIGSLLASTDADGTYKLTGVEQGAVSVRVARDGYVAQEKAVTVVANDVVVADIVLARPVAPNTTPVISSLSVEPQHLAPGGTASLVVVATDADGDTLHFTYMVDNGFTVTAGPTPGQATITAAPALNVRGTVTVVVDDGRGGSATGKVEVSTRENTLPVLSSVTATPAAVAPSGTLQLAAVARDAETTTLTYAWTAPTGWSVTGTGATVSLQAPATYGETGVVSVTVTDAQGGTTSGQVSVTTVANARPVVTSLTATPGQVAPAGTIALSVSADDALGDTLTYAWTAPSGWLLSGTGATVSLTAPAQYGQAGTVSVEVDDGHGGTVQASVVVSTGANRAPVLASLTAAPPTAQKSGTIALQASAADPDGDALSYAWTASAGWTLAGTGAAVAVTAPATAAQVGTITVVVSDGNGGSVTGVVIVSTAANHGPVIGSITANPSTVVRGGTTLLAITATDPDADPLTYAWTVPTGWTLAGSGAAVSLTGPATPGATGTVQVIVSDGTGGTASGSVIVSTATNSSPVLTSLTAAPPTVQKSGAIDLTATAGDADGDTLTYAWTAPSGWNLTGSGGSVSVTAPATPGATASVSLTITDGQGGSTTGSVVITTTPNAAPLVSSLTASPAVVGKGELSSLAATASDADGDTLTYAWTAPAGWTLAGTGASVTVTAPATAGASGIVLVTVSDGNGGTSSGSVAVGTLANRAPALSSLVASPPRVAKGQSLTATVFATDADGDVLSYAWVAPAGWTISGTGPSVSVTAPGTPDLNGVLSVTVTDGQGGTTAGSVAVGTSPNAAPVLASLTASPTPVSRGGTVMLQASASDADGDALSWAWTVSDPAWTLTPNGAQATLNAPNAYARAATVTLVVSDGFGGAVTATAAVATSANRAPQLQSLTSTPMPVLPGVAAALIVSATDADGDTLTYAWSSSNPAWAFTSSGPSVGLLAPYTNNSSSTVTVTVTDSFGASVVGTVIVSTSVCPTGFMNCDRNVTNACESRVFFDNANCGACGFSCSGATPYCGDGACYASPLPASRIATMAEANQINAWIGTTAGWRRCYSRTDDGALGTTFHTKCDGQGPSIVVATLSNGRKIGGYASASWNNFNNWFGDANSFLFSLTNSFKHAYPGVCVTCSTWMYGNNSYGPTFGGGHDWYVPGDITNGYCNLGYSYACRVGAYGSALCQSDFCGTYSGWTITDLEVWVR